MGCLSFVICACDFERNGILIDGWKTPMYQVKLRNDFNRFKRLIQVGYSCSFFLIIEIKLIKGGVLVIIMQFCQIKERERFMMLGCWVYLQTMMMKWVICSFWLEKSHMWYQSIWYWNELYNRDFLISCKKWSWWCRMWTQRYTLFFPYARN